MRKNVLRKLTVLVMAVVMVLSVASTSFAASGFTLADAYSKALDSANTTRDGVYNVEKESDDGVYEIEFTKSSNNAEYTFEYSKSGRLLEKDVDYNRARNTGEKKLTKTDAKKKVVKFGGFKYDTVDSGSCSLYKDDGEWIYSVNFKTKNYRYEYEVHANTGKILEYSKEYRY